MSSGTMHQPREGTSGRSSPAEKLMTQEKAKAAAGQKLRSDKSAQVAAGKKMRFEKAETGFDAASGNLHRQQALYGGKTGTGPLSEAVNDVALNKVQSKIEEDSDGNIGVEAADGGFRTADGAAKTGSNAFSRWKQKKDIRSEYAAQKRMAEGNPGSVPGAKQTVKTTGENISEKTGKAIRSLKDTGVKAAQFIAEHSHILLLIFGLLLVFMTVVGMMSSCSVFLQSGTNVVIDTSYTAEDEDILAVEEDYRDMEKELLETLADIPSDYEGYDEYNITADEIGHDPYELASYLTVVFENYKRREVQDAIRELFEKQYELEIEEVVETRYRTELVTDTNTYEDPETGELITETTTNEVQVPYDYYILNVTLTNHSLAYAIEQMELSEDKKERYEILMMTYGNKKYLFGDSPYAVATEEVLQYDVPGEALTDERFRNMITEAEKYLNYKYVWGGSNPSTSFDCSGYVSWVVNHCGNGWDVGRQTAEGLRQSCSIIPKSEAEPGDLIFFKGTYNTVGASHVGIYVGDGMMIHCGNPIQYTSCESSYWQNHFYCYGRLP